MPGTFGKSASMGDLHIPGTFLTKVPPTSASAQHIARMLRDAGVFGLVIDDF